MKKWFTAETKYWKVMKICAVHGMITMIMCGVAMAHDNHAQVLEEKLTLEVNEVPLEDALKKIESLIDVKFYYSLDQLKMDEEVSFKAENKALGEVLDEILTPHNINYNVQESDSAILLKREIVDPELDRSMFPDPIEQLRSPEPLKESITGTVRDAATQQPLPGVNIIVKGTTRGTTTDADGKFSIDADDKGILIFSFIGFKAVEIQVNGRVVIDVIMEADVTALKEVEVNAGYWKVKDREQTGNIVKINSDEIGKQPVYNTLAALQANVPGLQVVQTTGVAGGNFKVNIRGINSIANGNEPLYIIDGVPFTSNSLALAETSTELFGSLGTNPLNGLNPSDIESIEVLKDADATAIYGSRGSNGVILITTKKGNVGKTNFSIAFYSGIGRVTSKLDLLDTRDYLTMRNEAYRNDNLQVSGNSAVDLLQWDTTRYTDWQQELIGGTSTATDAQVSVSGGNEQTQFLINGGYHRETPVFPGNNHDQRISVHYNLSHKSPSEIFGAVLSMNYSAGFADLIKQDLTSTALTLAPVAPPIYNEQNELNWQNSTWINPLSYLNRDYESSNNTLVANAVLTIALMKDLELKANLGFTDTGMKAITTTPISSYSPSLAPFLQNEAMFARSNFQSWIAEPQLSWSNKTTNSNVSILIGATFLSQESEGIAQLGRGFSSEALMKNLKSASTVFTSSDTYSQYRYTAVFGRINYILKEKYVFNITGRRDGSSRFGPGNQFANFGAIGGAWIFSREAMFNPLKPIVNFGKLRASYGITGNDQLGDYQYLDTYTSTSGQYNGQIGLSPVRLSNPDFAWETNRKGEVALELGFANDRILFNASYYQNRSSNQLVGYPLPPTTGFNSIQGNFPAIVKNTGLEFELLTRNIEGENFSWTTSFNLTAPRNKLIEFPNLDNFPAYANTYVVGESLNVKKLYHFIGLHPTTGLYEFQDVDGDGELTTADRKTIKNIETIFYAGLQNTLNYKGFELSFLFQIVKQTGNNYLTGWIQAPGQIGNQPKFVMSRWQNEGDVGNVQKFTTNLSSPYRYVRQSDLSVGDASYFRLKNISLSYSFSQLLKARIRISNLKLFIQGQNLLTFSNYKGLDPENQMASSLPPLKVITAGLNLSF